MEATHLYIGHNGYPENDDSNPSYDNVTFTVPVNRTENAGEYSFFVEMPFSDLFNDFKTKEKEV